ncbi:MAG: AhpD family alkylhydroperoxidase, partial [Oceanospirillaceae bacterium]
FVPNLFGYMAEAPIAVKAYLQLNELLAQSSLPAAQLQVALLTSSVVNGCGFCTTAHRAIGKKSGANQQSLDALNSGDEIKDAGDRAVAKITKLLIDNRGRVEEVDINEFIAAGFTQQNYMELIVVVTIKTLSNYTNHVTKPEANPELLAML